MAGTFLDTMYPPEIDAFLPAFVVNGGSVSVPFSFSKYNAKLDTGVFSIHYSISNQVTNESELKDPSGVVITNAVKEDGIYYINIPTSVLTGNCWKNNMFYKLQMRFDIGDGVKDETVSQYISNMENQTKFSEWSKVCLLRPILVPNISLVGFSDETTTAKNLTRGLAHIVGRLEFTIPEGSSSNENYYSLPEKERLQSYQIKITDQEGNVLYSIDTVTTSYQEDQNQIDVYIDTQGSGLDSSSLYNLVIDYVTGNQYRGSQKWPIRITDYVTNPNFQPDVDVCVDNDEGIAKIHIYNEQTVFGKLWLKRSDSRSNFTEWETLKIFIVGADNSDSRDNIDIWFDDDTLSSILWYRYSVQMENEYGLMTNLYRSDVIMTDFYDMFLKRMGKKVPIRYNYKITSAKPTVSRTKIDTLGGKYPKFAENGNMNYRQMSVTGLISMQADKNETFLNRTDFLGNSYERYLDYKTNYQNVWFQGGYDDEAEEDLGPRDRLNAIDAVPEDAVINPSLYGSDDCDPVVVDNGFHSIDDNYDFFWEREYRRELVAWLNDGEPKLYRSMTEGNMCVMVTDVTLTPNTTLGRRIWDFSATLYEVGDGYSLGTLYDLGIIDIYSDVARKVIVDHMTEDEDGNRLPDLSEPVISVRLPGSSGIFRPGDTSQVKNGDAVDYVQIVRDSLDYRYNSTASTKRITGDMVLRNVKIFFHNPPHVFVQESDGSMDLVSWGKNDNVITEDVGNYHPDYDPSDAYLDKLTNPNEVQGEIPTTWLGYRFMLTDTSGSASMMYVPYRPQNIVPEAEYPVNGYYFIPTKIGVKALKFEDADDIVTIEYITEYDETSAIDSDDIKSIDVVRTVAGNETGSFEYDESVHDRIYNKYVFVSSLGYHDELQSWRGISLDTYPYTKVELKYYGSETYVPFIIGRTGVLNLPEESDIVDIKFVGRRMFKGDAHGEYSLEDWEFIPADSVPTDGNYEHNRVYSFDGTSYKIYYHNRLVDFSYEDGSSDIGTVHVGADASINYFADVLRIVRGD